MATSTNPPTRTGTQHQEEATFRNYDSSAAVKYAQYRFGWSEAFIQDNVIKPHISAGGELNVLVDIGCGPGNSTRCLAPHFQAVLGVDPSPAMVEAARAIPAAVAASTTASGEPIRYEVGRAEELHALPALVELWADKHGKECVDVITAATAAHWFDMAPFWASAAQILKPGGSLVLWGGGGFYVDPATTPNYAKVQRVLDDFENIVLAPFATEGNILVREIYAGLPLPWDCVGGGEGDADPKLKELLGMFDKEKFERREFNKDGKVAPGEAFVKGWKADFDAIRMSMGTASPVQRWREAYAEQVKSGEVEDLVDKLVRQVKELFDEVEEGKGRTWVDCGTSVGLLIVKKKK
ncbi:hypothetical protein LTR84_008952 [Exophiala bonariae]|uniref:Methyltransferase type 11 domain-containing protein n=1 Tax=Exophiala bonariae TaxID=1690606 RepID=A0AAV9MVY2_9EURO|nr:hypothetical protein LTR84_008952 [Exophiala bonariae]